MNPGREFIKASQILVVLILARVPDRVCRMSQAPPPGSFCVHPQFGGTLAAPHITSPEGRRASTASGRNGVQEYLRHLFVPSQVRRRQDSGDCWGWKEGLELGVTSLLSLCFLAPTMRRLHLFSCPPMGQPPGEPLIMGLQVSRSPTWALTGKFTSGGWKLSSLAFPAVNPVLKVHPGSLYVTELFQAPRSQWVALREPQACGSPGEVVLWFAMLARLRLGSEHFLFLGNHLQLGPWP